jgi:hypothetical protein
MYNAMLSACGIVILNVLCNLNETKIFEYTSMSNIKSDKFVLGEGCKYEVPNIWRR